jgi:aspartate 1-decarboxylase
MLRELLRCKLHGAVVSEADLAYEGSLTLPPELARAAGLVEGEKVLVVNVDTGARFETYVIIGRKPRHVALNGGAARLGEPGDRLLVLCFALCDEAEVKRHRPHVILVDERNRIKRPPRRARRRR